MKKRDLESQRKTEVRIKSVQDMMEEVRQKMEDIERWETMTNESSQSIDLRLQRLEDTAVQTASLLAVIHRFMATQVVLPSGLPWNLLSSVVATFLVHLKADFKKQFWIEVSIN